MSAIPKLDGDAGWEPLRQFNESHQVESYVSGSWGPTSSSLLLDRDGRAWHPES